MPLSLYFHIPFCKSRCGYCDFVTFAGFERLIPEYVHALEKQVSLCSSNDEVRTIFFGGGTPSLVPPEHYARLFITIRESFRLLPDAEITLEANPGTVDNRSLSEFRNMGFNRISFGMQSARPSELQMLERQHRPEDVVRAVTLSREAGFENINLDLIFGIPGQILKDWKGSLQAALDLSPEHLSLYSLIIEEGTPLARRIERGDIPHPDDDITADQYEWSCRVLEDAGFRHYEISNWAKVDVSRDLRCQHNMQYWRLGPYLGFGCGAVGFLPARKDAPRSPGQLMQNEGGINNYIKQVNLVNKRGDDSIFFKPVTETYEMETLLFMGFRLLQEGINPTEFQHRFNVDLQQVFGERIDGLFERGLIELSPEGNYRLTRNAWFTSNQVLREFTGVSD